MLTVCDLNKLQNIAVDLEQDPLHGRGREWAHWLNNSNADCGFVQCPTPRHQPPNATTEPEATSKWKDHCEEVTGAHQQWRMQWQESQSAVASDPNTHTPDVADIYQLILLPYEKLYHSKVLQDKGTYY